MMPPSGWEAIAAGRPEPPAARARPLIALVSRTPIVAEALAASLRHIGDVVSLDGGLSDLRGLLLAVRPDAIVCDSSDHASLTAALVGSGSPVLVQLSATEPAVLVLRDTSWERHSGQASLDDVRNVIASELHRREVAQ
jgi:hypothetical protein